GIDPNVEDGVVGVAILNQQTAGKRDLSSGIPFCNQTGNCGPAIEVDSIASIGTSLNRRTRSWQQSRIRDAQQFGVHRIYVDVFKNWIQGNFRLHAKVIGDLASFLSRQVEFSA